MTKLNVERMRKRVSVPRPGAEDPELPEGAVVITDAAGRVVRVIMPPQVPR